MNQMTVVKKSIITAACIALCIVLPMFFHGIQQAGQIFLPMHIPVFICGLICGWQYGLLCGLAGPALSSLLTGMPAVAILPAMMIELAVYGVMSGLLMKVIHTKKVYLDLYISLVLAMIIGRAVNAVCQALIFAPGKFSLITWVTGTLAISWPGVIIQLVLIPSLVFALMKAHLIPDRYPKLAED